MPIQCPKIADNFKVKMIIMPEIAQPCT